MRTAPALGACVPAQVWGRRESNPHALRHMILSHARLPVPTRPRKLAGASSGNYKRNREQWAVIGAHWGASIMQNQHMISKWIDGFLRDCRVRDLSPFTIEYYRTQLA